MTTHVVTYNTMLKNVFSQKLGCTLTVRFKTLDEAQAWIKSCNGNIEVISIITEEW